MCIGTDLRELIHKSLQIRICFCGLIIHAPLCIHNPPERAVERCIIKGLGIALRRESNEHEADYPCMCWRAFI